MKASFSYPTRRQAGSTTEYDVPVGDATFIAVRSADGSALDEKIIKRITVKRGKARLVPAPVATLLMENCAKAHGVSVEALKRFTAIVYGEDELRLGFATGVGPSAGGVELDELASLADQAQELEDAD